MPFLAWSFYSSSRDAPIGRSDALVARNFAKLGLGDALARVLAFVGSVYLARTLGADGYGVIAVALGVTLYLGSLVDFGVETLGVQRVAGARGDAGRLAGLFLTGRLVGALGAGGIAAGVALTLLPPLEGRVIALFLLTLIPVALSTRWVHLGLEQTGAVAVSRVGGELLVVTLVLTLVHGMDRILLVPLLQLGGDMLAAAWLLMRLLPAGVRVLPHWDRSQLVDYVKRAWPLVGHSLLGLLIFNSDLLFLRGFRGRAEVGWYAAAYALVSFLLNVGWAYAQSLLPTLTRLDRDGEDAGALYETSFAQVFAAILPVAVGGGLLAGPLILLVYGPEYARAGAALAILVWSVPLSLIRSVALIGLISRERQDLALRTTTSSAVVNIALNVLLIPPLGLLGAAIATVVTEVQRAVLALVFARSIGFPTLPWRRFWKPIPAALAMAIALLALPDLHVSAKVPLGAAVYGLALVLVGAVRIRGGLRLDV